MFFSVDTDAHPVSTEFSANSESTVEQHYHFKLHVGRGKEVGSMSSLRTRVAPHRKKTQSRTKNSALVPRRFVGPPSDFFARPNLGLPYGNADARHRDHDLATKSPECLSTVMICVREHFIHRESASNRTSAVPQQLVARRLPHIFRPSGGNF